MRGTFVCSQYSQCTAVYPILQNTGERWALIWQKYRRWTAKSHAKFKLTKYFTTFSHATARSEHYWIVSNSSIMLKHALKHIKTGRVTKIRALGGHFSTNARPERANPSLDRRFGCTVSLLLHSSCFPNQGTCNTDYRARHFNCSWAPANNLKKQNLSSNHTGEKPPWMYEGHKFLHSSYWCAVL